MSGEVKQAFKKAFKVASKATVSAAGTVVGAVDTVATATGRKLGSAAHAVSKRVDTAAQQVSDKAGELKDDAARETIERPLHKAVAKATKRVAELNRVIDLMGDLGIDANVIDTADKASLAFANAIVALKDRTDDVDRTTKQLLGTLVPAITSEAKKYRTMCKERPITATSASGQNVQVFWTDIPGYDELDQNQRAQLAQTVATKIEAGKQLYQSIINPGPNGAALPPATLKDVTNLVWAFKTAAQEKASAYEKGALTVPNGIDLRNYLDSCTDEVYPRISSHLPEHAEKEGQSARGMDFYDADPAADPDRLLPAGMNTLLYQMVTTPEGKDRLYVKMETEGMRVTPPGKDFKSTDSTAPKARKMRQQDVKNSSLHSYNWVKASLGKHSQDEDLKTYRENAPEALEDQANALVAKAPKPYRAALKLGLGKYLRINFFLKALSDLDMEFANPFSEHFDDAFADAVMAFLAEVDKCYSAGDRDDTFGDEIVLDGNLV